MYDYIILSIGKIVILHENNNIILKKEVNNTLIDLTGYELDMVLSIFNNKDKSLYYSEKLYKLIQENHSLNKNVKAFTSFLSYIESLIPENTRDNFYENIFSLDVSLNLESVGKIPEAYIKNSSGYTVTAGYNCVTNSIMIDKYSINKLYYESKNNSNSEEFFWTHINETVLHELLHASSTKYDTNTQIANCGFDVFPTENCVTNRGITEGLTELLAFAGIPGTREMASGYYIECLIVRNLINLVGREVLLESYFGNYGTIKIEEKLSELSQDIDSSLLFRRIEDNFHLRDYNCVQSILGNIQLTLIEYLRKKVEKELNNNVDMSIIENEINSFENYIIPPKLLKIINKNPDNYVGLIESNEEFIDFKNQILERQSVK